VVRGAEVHDLKRQVLHAEVLLCAEGDRQTYTIYGVRSFVEQRSSQVVILLKS
jgi:hypothetical protein